MKKISTLGPKVHCLLDIPDKVRFLTSRVKFGEKTKQNGPTHVSLLNKRKLTTDFKFSVDFLFILNLYTVKMTQNLFYGKKKEGPVMCILHLLRYFKKI